MGKIATKMQGSMLPNLTTVWQDEEGNVRTLQVPATLTGFMTNVRTSVTREITGTLTADTDQVANKGAFEWDLSAADVATAGNYSVYFIETVSTEPYKSLTVSWAIITAPTA